MAQEVSFKYIKDGLYRLTFDGRVLGDSRGYGTAQEASDEALRLVYEAKETARRGGFYPQRVYRPGMVG